MQPGPQDPTEIRLRIRTAAPLSVLVRGVSKSAKPERRAQLRHPSAVFGATSGREPPCQAAK
eukprot:9685070-Alexandrium_andersonii.AAC.1